MQERTHTLFDEKTISRLCSNVKTTREQKKSATEWLSLLESGSLHKEKGNYFRFGIMVLQEILGYPIRDSLQFEEDFIEFSFKDHISNRSVCIEAKGTSTKNLFADQHREKPEQRTPILQTWTNMGRGSYDYGIATNYREFALLDRRHGTARYYLFDFMSIKDNESKLKEFIAIFSKESLLSKDFATKLYEESVVEERKFTKEFYKLYHETRLMLIKEFQENTQISKEESIHYAQLFLNRLIFTFFAEDTGKIKKRLFSELILQSLNPLLVSEYSRYACDTILNLFERLDKGSQKPIEIFGFNGGLFSKKITPSKVFFQDLRASTFFKEVLQHSELKKQIKLDEFSQEVVDRFSDNLNPIISNLLVMSSFDFQSELNVDILGNIFEQSLTDLEELQALPTITVSTRKKEGIYYTPRYITDYICRNTIISYLSKSGTATSIGRLIEEFTGDIEQLEARFRDLKIVDPACGSGAFLITAVEILLEIHKQIRIIKEMKGRYTVEKKGKKLHSSSAQIVTLEKWNEEEEARTIIENNIFGVDINEESVEITKLSLFLKIASTNRKLFDLSRNIRVGNSIIDDSTIAGDKAFNWSLEFKEIFEKGGGFDIVIGNPPYLRIQGLHESHDHTTKFLETNYVSTTGRYDFYIPFIERGSKLLKKGGYLGFIVPHKFVNSQFGKGIRKYLSERKLMHKFVNFGHNIVFEDVATYTGIVILRNAENPSLLYKEITDLEAFSERGYYLDDEEEASNFIAIEQSRLGELPWNLSSGLEYSILEKIRNSGPEVLEYFDKILQGVIAGDASIYFLRLIKDNGLTITFFSEKIGSNVELEKAIMRPLLFGEDVKRYLDFEQTNRFTIYPYTIEGGKQRILEEAELKNNFPLAYEYLLQFKDHLIKLKKKFKTNPRYWYSLHRGRQQIWFEKEKVITPDITVGCNMTLDKNKLFHNDTVYSFPKKDSVEYDNRYFLVIFNSKLLWFFLKSTGAVLRGGYFRFKTEYLKPFHIPYPQSEKEENDIVVKTDRIMSLYKEFYSKSEKFQQRAISSFKLERIPKSLDKFYELDFDMFLNEMREFSKVKLSLDEVDEWQDYFNRYQSTLLKLRTDIGNLELDLNNIVYDLYKLNPEERKFVDENQ